MFTMNLLVFAGRFRGLYELLEHGLERLLYDLRVGLALGHAHDLADEEAADLGFSGAQLLELLRVTLDDLADHRRDHALVRDLTVAIALDDLRG